MWNDRIKVQEKQSPPPTQNGLASYVTQHKCDSSFMWTQKLQTSLSSRKQSSTSTIRKPPTAQKLSVAVRNTYWQRETDHSWPTYSHLIMLAHYTRCNMALHPPAHATVSNNAGLFQQSEYIYSWRPLMETPAFQSSLAVSGKKARKRRREREIKGEREVCASSSPKLKWTVHSPLRAGLLSNMACEWDSSLSSLPHINSSDCESSAAAAACDRYSDI